MPAPPTETEVKVKLDDPRAFAHKLRAAGFRVITPRTHEHNTLFDLPGGTLRAKREVLRIRLYGKKWTVTHKSRGKTGKHKSRVEQETSVQDGRKLAAIFESLGYRPAFIYEKYRTEYSDDAGHVVLDETPIGAFAEIEGRPRWIDRTAKLLGFTHREYITASYAQLFSEWKQRTASPAQHMTFADVRKRK